MTESSGPARLCGIEGCWRFAYWVGVRVSSGARLGLPAYSRARIL